MAKGMNIANRSTTGDKLNNRSIGDYMGKLTNTANRSTKSPSAKSPAGFGKIGQNTQKALTTKGLGNKSPKGGPK